MASRAGHRGEPLVPLVPILVLQNDHHTTLSRRTRRHVEGGERHCVYKDAGFEHVTAKKEGF